MGERSENKKELILEKASEVFSQKGYLGVTMSDIVSGAGISRGGLYLYYTGTEEVFRDVIEGYLAACRPADPGAGTPAERLAVFLREQKKRILRKKGSLERALYEYSFSGQGKDYMKADFDEGVRTLSEIIASGVDSGEFQSPDPVRDAENIMYLLLGMRIKARTFGIRSSEVDSEILYMISLLASS